MFGSIQICTDMVRMEYLHFLFFNLRDNTILCGIAENEFFLYRSVQSIVQHHVNAPHGGVT